MTLSLPGGVAFTTGACDCVRPGPAPDESRLYISIRLIEAQVDLNVLVDTGGYYLILHPDFGPALDLMPSDALARKRLFIRGEYRSGGLHRIPVGILATDGDDLEFQATVFIADPDEGPAWDLPDFIGWIGCLERIRFAVDPVQSRFYFGAP